MAETVKPLDTEALQQLEGLAALASLVARELRGNGIVTLFVNRDQRIELVPPHELVLDSLAPQEAARVLLDRGYEDEGVLLYLRGREDRERLRGGG
jgi:hypothetical protein